MNEYRNQEKKEKTKKDFIRNFFRVDNSGSGCRVFVDIKNTVFMVLKQEQGFMEDFILATWLVCFLTIMAFIAGLGFGYWKQAQAKYGYLAESTTFAVEAANMTGMIGGVEESEEMAKEFFETAMTETVEDYRLERFYAVEKGDSVPGGGRAEAPGFVAEVTIPLVKINVPLIGEQQVNVPMAYFAAAKSQQVK